MRHWTEEERGLQSERMRHLQLWKKGGVKTPEGKAKSRMNALKHGLYSEEIKLLRRYLKHCRKQLKALEQCT